MSALSFIYVKKIKYVLAIKIKKMYTLQSIIQGGKIIMFLMIGEIIFFIGIVINILLFMHDCNVKNTSKKKDPKFIRKAMKSTVIITSSLLFIFMIMGVSNCENSMH